MNTVVRFVNCLYAGASEYRPSAGSGLAAARQASADLLFAVTAALVIVGVVVIVLSLCKHHA